MSMAPAPRGSRTLAVSGVGRLLLVLLLTGCAGRRPDTRPAGGCHEMLHAELLFGLTRPDGAIDAAGFEAFLDRSVTPRFPAGLTVLDGAGRWRAPDGRMTQEASKVVLIVSEPGPQAMVRLQAIRNDYKATFHQQSVGLLLSPTCADF